MARDKEFLPGKRRLQENKNPGVDSRDMPAPIQHEARGLRSLLGKDRDEPLECYPSTIRVAKCDESCKIESPDGEC